MTVKAKTTSSRAASYNGILVDDMSEDEAKNALVETMELLTSLTDVISSHVGAINPTVVRLKQLLQKGGYIA